MKTLRGAAMAIAECFSQDVSDVRESEYQKGRYPTKVYTPFGNDYYTATASGKIPFDASKYAGWEELQWVDETPKWFMNRYTNRIFKLVRVNNRTDIERAIVLRVVKDALKVGYKLSVHDGDGYQVHRSTDEDAIINHILTIYEPFLLVNIDERRSLYIAFVYGNDGYDVISDYHIGLQEFMKPIEEWIKETYEPK